MEPSHLPPGRNLQQSHSFQQPHRHAIRPQYVPSSPMTMQIPNRRLPDAPPPLPPPRYVNDDPPEDDEPYESRPFGGFPKTWSHREEGRRPRPLQPSPRGFATAPSSWCRSPTDSDRRYEDMRAHHDEGYYSLSGPSISQLPGEKQLHRGNQERSSQTYDQNLLGKLGRPADLPARQPMFSSLGSAECSPTIQFSRQNTLRSLSFPNTNSSLLSDPPIKQEPGRFADSPRVSPRTSKAYPPEFRSPFADSSTTVEPASQRFPTSINIERQQKSRRSENGLLSRLDESAPAFIPNPVKLEIVDQPIFSDPDSTVRMTERVRRLDLDATTPTPTEVRFPDSARCSMSNPTGTKRKLSQEDHNATLTQQAVKATELFRSPHLTSQFAPHHDSISSQSSGYRHDSYASSIGADGSYTSVEQPSPVSPTEAYQQYMTQSYDTKPRKQSQNFQCTCCAKKPKKFETAEELHQHQNEKQYICMYCSNKFKNKNEMERHQNSIHKRTNSWSCAELDKAEDVFFPTTAFGASGGQFQATTNGTSVTDLCGYCGQEFPNEPKDLEARRQHLASNHKFRDCSNKKFWRADHFRQHLKHSHGGKTGRHTNALEQRCARELPPQVTDPANSAPVANMRPPEMDKAMPPPSIPLDMANIDPSMGPITQAPPAPQPPPPPQGLQIQDPSIGYEYKVSE